MTQNLDQAQPGAQLQQAQTCEPQLLMAIEIIQDDLAVILQVMAQAGIAQAEAARACNIVGGHMSRILSGQAPLPFALVRWLWDRTSDQRLLHLLGAGNPGFGIAAYRRASIPEGITVGDSVPTVLRECASALDQSQRGLHAAAAHSLQGAICTLTGAMREAQRRAESQPAPVQPIAACKAAAVDLRA